MECQFDLCQRYINTCEIHATVRTNINLINYIEKDGVK